MYYTGNISIASTGEAAAAAGVNNPTLAAAAGEPVRPPIITASAQAWRSLAEARRDGRVRARRACGRWAERCQGWWRTLRLHIPSSVSFNKEVKTVFGVSPPRFWRTFVLIFFYIAWPTLARTTLEMFAVREIVTRTGDSTLVPPASRDPPPPLRTTEHMRIGLA